MSTSDHQRMGGRWLIVGESPWRGGGTGPDPGDAQPVGRQGVGQGDEHVRQVVPDPRGGLQLELLKEHSCDGNSGVIGEIQELEI